MRRTDEPGGLSLRHDLRIDDPLGVVLRFVAEGWVTADEDPRPTAFDESDLRRANRGGARISAAEIAVVLDRRRAIERALGAIAPDASLVRSAPWEPLHRLFDAFADVSGFGFSKLTKTLHPKRPALIPILDSVVQTYLRDDDLGARAPFADRALALVRGFARELDDNRTAVRTIRRELAQRGHELTEVRILDLLIWSTGTM
jgi:hypothetical protein